MRSHLVRTSFRLNALCTKQKTTLPKTASMSTDKQNISIDEKSVSITLFIPLCPKAAETKRKNPLIVDNKAVEIVDKLNG